ncbi:cation:proton antiporter [Paracoccus sediminis]|uniref:Cation:proton antiporter n=1 Tax=Paracoccus sediminis TaxID=1214787 RepID=A0A238XSA1_9RHOB|nr:cation:proton antiporter [Paracoccus sediminis]TBN47880.1 cation:proton antiporter [Paracoccus sediminis]SNR61807.1 Kef-type K+ transport system, membrane component KefB [Paracoccus sediminis]
MNELLALVILIAAARMGGELATRFRQSPMLGEIIAGLLLGPTALNLIAPSETLEFLGHLGILFMTFLAGMETDLRMLRKVAGPSVLVSALGIALSVGLGFAVGWIVDFGVASSLFLGAALSTSSIAVTARVFTDFKLMRTRVGLLSMAAHAIDDILAMMLIIFVVSFFGGEATSDPVWLVLGKVAAFLLIAAVIGLWILKPVMGWVYRLRSREMHFTVAILLVLGFGWMAEFFGLADVLGAFAAGAFLHYTDEAEPAMVQRVEALSDGFLVPVFFGVIGLQTDLFLLLDAVPLVALALVAAVVSKLAGCGMGARLTGYSLRESVIVGAGMVPRAGLALIMLGLVPEGSLPAVMAPLLVAIVFLTALVTAPILRLAVKPKPETQTA